MTDDVVPSQPSVDGVRGGATYDAIIIGAGMAGIYQLFRLREQNLSVLLLEAGSGVGGTWYWNRYPGARLDSESYTYGYFFSDVIRDEWSWSEEFVGQPELERYLNFVVDRLDLRRHIQLDSRVSTAEFDDQQHSWHLHVEDGRQLATRFLISAVGILSTPQFPNVPGLEDFTGDWHHTALWPAEPVDFVGKRVAIVGTGSSGIQLIPIVANEAASLTVFQRTPNWATPINNQPITADRAAEIRRLADQTHQVCLDTATGFKHRLRNQDAADLPTEERQAYLEQLWHEPGLTMYLKNFRDLMTSEQTNALVTEFLSAKIRERVRDSAVADKLIPTDHGYGMKRPPLETNYYEAYNNEAVTLISLADEPLVRFTSTGVQTTAAVYEVDIIVLATGFDAVTGTIVRIDIHGTGDRTLKEHWIDGPRTFMGLQVAGFPNLFIVGGPQAALGNNPRLTEVQVDWVASCIQFMLGHQHAQIETTEDFEDLWSEHIADTLSGTLTEKAQSWSFGSNTPGKKRAFLLYAGGLGTYRSKLDASARDNYRGFIFDEGMLK